MASLSGVSSSNTLSSLMNSANMISGLASGLDTEGMIESLVKSYQAKISQLNQKVTKLEWKQDSYRSIISNMVNFSSKYASYTSNTNLMSRSFFSNAVKVSALGKYADMVSASGKTSSKVSLNAVHQLATSAQYRTGSNLIAGDGTSIEASEAIDLGGTTTLARLNGSLTLTYGSQTVSINFDQVADVKAMKEIREKRWADGQSATDTEVLAELINQKLSGQTIGLTGGESADATERIQVTVEGARISFKDKSTAGNSVFVSGASGNVANTLGIADDLENKDKDKPKSFNVAFGLTREADNSTYLSGKTMNLSLDGVTKSIRLPTIYNGLIVDTDGSYVAYNAKNYTRVLNDSVQAAFNGKVKVTNEASDDENLSLKLRFEVPEGSNLAINTSVGDTLGIGQTATSYMNTGKTLGELMGDKLKGLTATGEKDKKGDDLYDFVINGVKVGSYSKNSTLAEVMSDINSSKAGVKVSYSQTTKKFLFESAETGSDSEVKLGDGLAKAMFGVPGSSRDTASDTFKDLDWEEGSQWITFKVPGGSAATFEVTRNMTMQDIVNELKTWPFELEGYQVSYDEDSGKIVATDTDGNKLDFKVTVNGEEGEELEYSNASKVSYTKGQDAVFNVTVNGETMQMTRSSNTVNIDGLTITMKDTFNSVADKNGEPVKGENGKYQVESKVDSVTFNSSTDSDKIINVIRDMVNDYNAMMTEIKSAYMTMPYQTSSGAFTNYEPLTEEEMEGMSESAIARYEEKAKQGILFGDRTLSALYNKMNQAFSFSNKADIDTLKDMGITVNYNVSDGTQAISLDEDKLRAILDSDPDRVADLFTKADGVMDRMKTQLDNYAKTTGEPKGILIQQAGSPLSALSLLNNTWQSEIDSYTKQIEKWQDKLEAQVERYTSQFARLEQLINQMNSQSSALAGMLGGT